MMGKAFCVLSYLLALHCLDDGVHAVVGKPTVDAGWQPAPGDAVPYGFTVTTLNISASSVGSYTLNAERGLGLPLIVHAYLPQDAALRYMWSPANRESIRLFLEQTPTDTHYLFVSYGLEAQKDSRMMLNRLLDVLTNDMGLSLAEAEKKLANFHFSLAGMAGISDQGANFIPYLMGHWRSGRQVATASYGSNERDLVIERLDAAYDWLPWPPPQGVSPVAALGNGCRDVSPFDVTGSIALVVRDAAAPCSFAEIISRAQVAGAAGVAVSALEGEDVAQMGCTVGECALPLHIFATMIPHAAAVAIRDAALEGHVTLSFDEETGPGYYAAVDSKGLLQEVGWIKLPSLQHLSWAAQWLHYTQSLQSNLSKPALVVPVFEEEIMQGEHGISVEVDLPPKASQYDKLELDFELGCPGRRDEDCPIWDHVVQLFVCCGNDAKCDSCDVTPWLHQHHPEDSTEQEWQLARQSRLLEGEFDTPEQRCGREIARYITPFRRRVGRWITDVSPLRPLISSQRCRFTAQTAPWALPWKPSLRLRFSEGITDQTGGRGLGKPLQLVQLFKGGTFDADYNADRQPVKVATPEHTSQALLYAVITGHGSDDNNCAEFCPTSHYFVINGHEHVVNFTSAGTLRGCTKHVAEGDVPNEHGTWMYGRNGWCDGQAVKAHVLDVTKDIQPEGETNVIEYYGLFRGKDPHPKNNAGYIMQQSSLTFYGKPPAAA